ncbi:CHAT domain-containing protein [Winogradskya consettensis]|uniref:CHAT domain-containing protein n=1 Tax=Winogradskya consettensis TaxID=113560 RepID=A0A919VYP6_9ACTN|nr:CHAT domain-containing protein [Actinoplanes consettensis]GIM80622.1 CHAT domain-containing protein [Actinoplanes consettensis]
MTGDPLERLSDAAADLYEQYRATRDEAPLWQAVDLLRHVTTAEPDPEVARPYLSNLGAVLIEAYVLSGRGALQDEAATALRAAVAGATTPSGPALVNLASLLLNVGRRTGALESLLEAVTVARRAAEVPGDDRRAGLDTLANCLMEIYQQTGDENSLRESVGLSRAVIALLRNTDPSYVIARLLNNLAVSLGMLAQHDVGHAALDEAESLMRRAVAIEPVSHVDMAARQGQLALLLMQRHDQTGDVAALAEAVQLYRECERRSGDHERLQATVDLALALLTDYRRTSTLATLDEAIALLEAADDTVSGGRSRAGRALGTLLAVRYQHTGESETLQRALAMFRASEPDKSTAGTGDAAVMDFNTHGAALIEAYERTGDTFLLDQAVDLLAHAVAIAGSRRTTVVQHAMANLGAADLAHHHRLADQESLDRAIRMFESVLGISAAGDPSRPGRLLNGAVAYVARYELLRQNADLVKAEQLSREAIVSGHDAYISNAARSALGEVLRLRSEEPALNTGVRLGLLNEAIAQWREALLLVVDEPLTTARYLNNLGSGLLDRYGFDGMPPTLQEALTALREAVELLPSDHPSRVVYLSNLASALFTTADSPESPVIVDAIDRLRAAEAISSGAPQHRLWAAYTWAKLAARYGDLNLALDGFDAGFAVLPRLTGSDLDRRDREQRLAELSDLARDAAACALQRGTPGDARRALDYLEQGRGVLLREALAGQIERGLLERHRPDMATRFDELFGSPDVADRGRLALPTPGESALRRARVRQREALVREIRDSGVPELASLLTPPRPDDLATSLNHEAVVFINVSGYRCDALVVTMHGVRAVYCPKLDATDIHDRTTTFRKAMSQYLVLAATASPHLRDAWRELRRQFTEIAKWLWDAGIGKILDVVDGRVPGCERITWIPTGPLAGFPLHAAGRHGSGDTVFDRVISSYAPTLDALARSRLARGRPLAAPSLVVAVPQGHHIDQAHMLPQALVEAEFAAEHLPQALPLNGSNATVADVAGKLAVSEAVHLACHAVDVPADPSASHLVLHDGVLTVAQLGQLSARSRRLAFLSACGTAAASEHVPDESINLAAAFHALGYEHVIASIWPVPDATAVMVTRGWYEHLSRSDQGAGPDPDAAAHCLHEAVRSLVERDPTNPFPWSFIHTGR